jgi:sugar/nucleoside kinase (ribokinase family)
MNPPGALGWHRPPAAGGAAGSGSPKVIVVGTISTDCVADRRLAGLLRRGDTAKGWVMRPGTYRLLARDAATSLMDLAHGGHSRILPGGAGYRIAEALTVLRLGLSVGFVGVLGTGPAAAATITRMRAAGIDHHLVLRHPRHPVGVTLYLASPGGYAVLAYPGANMGVGEHLLAAHDDLVVYLAGAHVVYLAELPGRHTADRLADLLASVKARNPRSVVVLDPGLNGVRDRTGASELLRLADVVLCDYHRLARLSALPAGTTQQTMSASTRRRMSDGATLLLHQVHQVLAWQPDPAGTGETCYPTSVTDEQIVETFGVDEAFTTGLLASVALTGSLNPTGLRLATAMLRHRLTHTDRGPGDLAAVAHGFPDTYGPGHPNTRPPGGRHDPTSGPERD